jgi:hypothetical protein
MSALDVAGSLGYVILPAAVPPRARASRCRHRWLAAGGLALMVAVVARLWRDRRARRREASRTA